MEKQDYTTSIDVNATPQEAFKSINSVTKWWTADLVGSSQELNDEFTVRFEEVHVSTQKLVELIPDKKLVWLVTYSKLNFAKPEDEWTNTEVIFEISRQDNKTKINFTHRGLVPGIQCYDGCSKGWDYFINGSLFKLLTEGKGTPGFPK